MHPLSKEYIESFNAGGSRRAITKGHIESFQIPLPPLREQQAITCILGALDDKIELNRRRNRTLEAMARAIFQSWFVDFDPVKAKAAGRTPPGLSPALAALFPDRFEESTLGPIPAGWRAGTLSDLAAFVLGGDWGKDSKSDETPSSAHCIRGADIPSLQSGGLGEMPIRHLKETSLEKRALREGDLVVEISGGSPTQSTGRPVLITSGLLTSLEHPLICSNFCRLFRPNTRIYSEYQYHLDGAYLMRSGEELVPMSEDRLRGIFAEGQPDWLEEPSRTTRPPSRLLPFWIRRRSSR